MTYEQSWENIYKLLSLIRPSDDQRIIFEYSSNSDYKILTENLDVPDFVESIIHHQVTMNIPFAQMYYDKNGEDVLSYHDANGDWVINMSTLRLNRFAAQTEFSLEKVQKQFLELARMAKKG